MDIYNGRLTLVDKTHISQILGSISLSSSLELLDTTHVAELSGYIINDSTYFPGDATFFQNSVLGQNDMTFVLADWTYAHGIPNVDGTLVGGTLGYRWFDPYWIHYSIYYKDYDTSEFSLMDYRYREPVRKNVGQYYASMVMDQPGHYEMRWVYQRESLGFAQEKIQKFTSMSQGLDAMRDYPTGSGDGT